MEEKTGERNKTINTSVEEGKRFLDRCISVREPETDTGRVMDKTIWGDMLDVCALLPRESVDLIIADPPYNLTKSFQSTIFKIGRAHV